MSVTNPIYWLLKGRGAVPAHYDWLCSAEKEVLSGMRFTKRRNDWLIGRWTAKQLIVNMFKHHIQEADIQILATESGAPGVLLENNDNHIEISISHSSDHGFCVASNGVDSIGCDLELIQPRKKEFEQDYYTLIELDRLQNQPQKEHAVVSNLIWCGKEAVLKTLKTGLRRDTRSIEVTIPDVWSYESWNIAIIRDVVEEQLYNGYFRVINNFVLFVASSHHRELIHSPVTRSLG